MLEPSKWKVKKWAGIVLLVLAVVFFLQNNYPVRVQLFFWHMQASQLIVLPLVLLAGVVIGLALGRYFWNRPVV